MAKGKQQQIAAGGGLFLLLVVVVAAVVVVVGALLVPAKASADACTEECYKECDKQQQKQGKNNDASSCTDTCDGICRLKAATREYAAAATPAEQDAIMENLDKQALAAGSAAAASTPGFAKLKSGCIRECHNNKDDVCKAKSSTEAGKEEDCTEWCDTFCRAATEGLTFAAEAYANTPDAERKATIQAIDKQRAATTAPDHHNVEAFAATCMGGCSKVCDKDPDCITICDNGCRARAVAVVIALATPAQKEAISKDIQDAKAKAGSPPPVA
uniref:Uncharacterized protein n=1 Tax=Avena sativa TaxID=4498 RepID=A0ACD6AJE7_AVESA